VDQAPQGRLRWIKPNQASSRWIQPINHASRSLKPNQDQG
jgi:hypothetical protein